MTRTDDGKGWTADEERAAHKAWLESPVSSDWDPYYAFLEGWHASVRAHQQDSLPVEAIEYALATMDLELDYLCSQYSQRPGESGERDTWKRRIALCKAHIQSLRALLPSPPEPLMPKTEAK